MKNVVVKHIECIPLTKESLSLEEIRLLNSCLHSQDTLCEGMQFVDINKFAELHKVPFFEAFNLAEKLITKWVESTYKFKWEENYYLVNLISVAEISPEKRTIRIEWNKPFIPLISGKMPAGKFISINIKMSKTSSKMRYDLYEELQKNIYKLYNKGVKYIEYSVEELREVTGCVGKYEEFGDFNRSVIKPTLDDIYKNTGLKLYATKRRSWTKVKFSLKEK